MRRQKKNRLFTFICSLLPGAAEMYMGFMKSGVSLMAVFFLSFVIPSVLRTSDVFVLGAFLIWFYCFFHARNLAACSEEILREMPDLYIWEEFMDGRKIQINNPTLRKWFAIVLIVCGVVTLWQNFASFLYAIIPDYLWELLAPLVDRIPAVAISLLIIVIGVQMIMGKKVELDEAEKQTGSDVTGKQTTEKIQVESGEAGR